MDTPTVTPVISIATSATVVKVTHVAVMNATLEGIAQIQIQLFATSPSAKVSYN